MDTDSTSEQQPPVNKGHGGVRPSSTAATLRGHVYPIPEPPEASSPITEPEDVSVDRILDGAYVVRILVGLQRQIDFEREQFEIASKSATETAERWRHEYRRRQGAEAEIDRLVGDIAEKDTLIRSLREPSGTQPDYKPPEDRYGRGGEYRLKADPDEQSLATWARAHLARLVRVPGGGIGRLAVLRHESGTLAVTLECPDGQSRVFPVKDLFKANLEHPLDRSEHFEPMVDAVIRNEGIGKPRGEMQVVWTGKVEAYALDFLRNEAWISTPMLGYGVPPKANLIKFPSSHSLFILEQGHRAVLETPLDDYLKARSPSTP